MAPKKAAKARKSNGLGTAKDKAGAAKEQLRTSKEQVESIKVASPIARTKGMSVNAKKKKIVELLRGGKRTEDACGLAKVDLAEYYRWFVTDKRFKIRVAAAKEIRAEVVADEMYSSAVAKDRWGKRDTKAGEYFLNNRDKENWSSMKKVELGGKDGQPLAVVLGQLSAFRRGDKAGKGGVKSAKKAAKNSTKGKGGD